MEIFAIGVLFWITKVKFAANEVLPQISFFPLNWILSKLARLMLHGKASESGERQQFPPVYISINCIIVNYYSTFFNSKCLNRLIKNIGKGEHLKCKDDASFFLF